MTDDDHPDDHSDDMADDATDEKAYRDVPGTTIFDAERSRQGYWLNQFCMSLMSPEARDRFRADEAAALEEWPMTPEQRQAVRDRDFNRMIELGGNIYFLAKIGATDGLSFQQIASSMTGMSEQEYRDMMIAGGRPPEGNRYRHEWAPAGAGAEPEHRP
jgi:protocatechuate 4,5-dioxygenase alpha subunit